MNITEFLEARIAEDESAAREASIGSESWKLGEYDETILWWPPSNQEKIAFVRQQFGDEIAAEHACWAGQTIESCGEKIAPHIARHDPARVLAECAAKRAIIRSYDSCVQAERATADFGPRLVTSGMVKGLEIALRVIASIYSAHPDYQQEWVK